MKSLSLLASACALLALPAFASATVHLTDNVDITTNPNPGGGGSDGTGVWFNPLTGYVEQRGFLFPSPLFEDGKFFLVMNESFTTTAAQINTEGFFSRGNDSIYASSSNLNPGRYTAGTVIGPGTGFQSPGTGFPDLGPTFGNFPTGGYGFIGLMLRDPTGTSASDIFYGYAEINVNPDFSTTLLSFAYNDVRNAPITTVSTVPEPTAIAAVSVLAGGLIRRRRK